MQIPQFQFNANQYEPNQGIANHPPALKIPFTITNTAIVETSKKDGHMLVIDFTSPIGTVIGRYNINNPNPKAVEIAYGQLSAVCRAVNIYQIDGNNECAALRGGKGLMDVGYQKGEEPDAAFPDRKGYTELKKVYDVNGNEPGKAPAQQAQPQGQAGGGAQPLQQQPGGSWGPQPTAQPNPAPAQPQPNPAPNGGQAWQPGGGQQGAAPPWGNR